MIQNNAFVMITIYFKKFQAISLTQILTFSWLKMNAFLKNPIIQKGTLKITLGTYLTIDRGFFTFKISF